MRYWDGFGRSWGGLGRSWGFWAGLGAKFMAHIMVRKMVRKMARKIFTIKIKGKWWPPRVRLDFVRRFVRRFVHRFVRRFVRRFCGALFLYFFTIFAVGEWVPFPPLSPVGAFLGNF